MNNDSEEIKEEVQEKTQRKSSKKTKEGTENKASEQLIYCGPTIGLKITKNTVFIGGIPKNIDKEISECEQIKKLFVPIDKYIETKSKIEEDGTIENLSYRAVESYLKGEV